MKQSQRTRGHARNSYTTMDPTPSQSSSFGMDSLLRIALALLLSVYTFVTLATYNTIEHVHASTSSSSSSTVPITSNPRPPPVGAFDSPITQKRIQRLQHGMFPLHVHTNDTETIVHPGYALLKKQSDWPPDVPTTMTVPQLFDVAYGAYYFDATSEDNNNNNKQPTIRHFLGQYGTHLMTPAQASAIGSYATGGGGGSSIPVETIYASVASYRDPECRATIADLYARAQIPDRVRVAVVDQRLVNSGSVDRPCIPEDCSSSSAEDEDVAMICKYRHLIDVHVMDARLAVGPVFARHLAHRHYRGEYFAMQIDSHVRFIQNWDTDIIEQWKSANNEMAVLSTYLSDMIGSIDPITHANRHPSRPIMCVSDYEGSGPLRHLRHGQQPEGPPGIHGQPTLHPFWAAGFSFARGHFVIQVPYDQYLPMVFQGEEISMGLRGFTYGYDYYAAERSVCFHMYAIKENEARRKKIPLFWENAHVYSGVGVQAMKRLNTIIGMQPGHKNGHYGPSDYPHEEIVTYGLGQVRKPQQFFDTFGIDVVRQTVQHHLCRFVGKPMMKEFLPALRSNRMGLDYSRIHYRFVDPAPAEKPAAKKHH